MFCRRRARRSESPLRLPSLVVIVCMRCLHLQCYIPVHCIAHRRRRRSLSVSLAVIICWWTPPVNCTVVSSRRDVLLSFSAIGKLQTSPARWGIRRAYTGCLAVTAQAFAYAVRVAVTGVVWRLYFDVHAACSLLIRLYDIQASLPRQLLSVVNVKTVVDHDSTLWCH